MFNKKHGSVLDLIDSTAFIAGVACGSVWFAAVSLWVQL